MQQPPVIAHGESRRKSIWRYLLGGLSVVLTLALCALAVVYWQKLVHLSYYGYIGMLFVSLLSGIAVPAPVPSILLVFTLGGVLNPILVGMIAGIGETAGSMAVYFTGHGGARAVQALDQSVMRKFGGWIRTRGVSFSIHHVFDS